VQRLTMHLGALQRRTDQVVAILPKRIEASFSGGAQGTLHDIAPGALTAVVGGKALHGAVCTVCACIRLFFAHEQGFKSTSQSTPMHSQVGLSTMFIYIDYAHHIVQAAHPLCRHLICA
jgi:hypothetical protein